MMVKKFSAAIPLRKGTGSRPSWQLANWSIQPNCAGCIGRNRVAAFDVIHRGRSVMPVDLMARIGRVELKNPLIAAPAEHLSDADGVRRALRAGVGAVVVKSTSESQAAREQLQRAEYLVIDERWRPVPWNREAPAGATIACRSGLTPQSFEEWLAQTVVLDREARSQDSYAVASLILAELDPALDMA